MGVYLSGLAILRRMSIKQVMREACLPVEYVGVPLIQPQVSSRLVISAHLSQNRTYSEVESFGTIPPRNLKTLGVAKSCLQR